MKKYDVIVVGGGFSGVACAVAVAREGFSVLLIEKNQSLGGTASNCLVNPFMNFFIEDRKEGQPVKYIQLNNGIFSDILNRMNSFSGVGVKSGINSVFNIEYLKFAMENLCEENNIDVLYGTIVLESKVEDGKIQSIKIYNRDGYSEVSAKFFADCSGDGNLSYMSKVPFQLGRKKDNLCQPMTLCFWISNVDIDKFNEERKSINPLYQQFQREGKIANERENVLIFKHISRGILHFNTTRITKLDPTNAKDITKAQFIARKQVFEMFNFLKDNFECFKNATLLMTAPEIGVRESRKIQGDYIYKTEDILNYTIFDDSIACGCYEIDLHNPDGTGTHLIYLDRTKYYTIPYRSLIPKGIDNMLVAGRCISSTQEAQSAYRIMPIVCNIGEGAGTALSVCLKDDVVTRKADINKVHSLLDMYGMRYK